MFLFSFFGKKGFYFLTDLGFQITTGRGLGDRLDGITGGTHSLYNGVY
jgi:hypothetical protein